MVSEWEHEIVLFMASRLLTWTSIALLVAILGTRVILVFRLEVDCFRYDRLEPMS